MYCSTPEASYRNLSYTDTLGEANCNVCHLVFPRGAKNEFPFLWSLITMVPVRVPHCVEGLLIRCSVFEGGGNRVSFYIIWLLCLSENVPVS